MQQQTGKVLIAVGAILLLAGLFFYFSDRLPFFGKMPGDIVVKKKNFSFYFPLGTSILISIVLSFLLYLLSRFR